MVHPSPVFRSSYGVWCLDTWMYLCTPTRDFLRASKDEEYSIFFFILALKHNVVFPHCCWQAGWMRSPVRAPGHQEQLLLLGRVGGALALVLVLEIVQTVSKEAYYVDVCNSTYRLMESPPDLG